MWVEVWITIVVLNISLHKVLKLVKNSKFCCICIWVHDITRGASSSAGISKLYGGHATLDRLWRIMKWLRWMSSSLYLRKCLTLIALLPMMINAVNNESDIDCFLRMFLLTFFNRICFRAYFPRIKFCAIPLYLWDLYSSIMWNWKVKKILLLLLSRWFMLYVM